jgi:hypothetical protein
MASQITLDISTSAQNNTVLIIGDANNLLNGGFESFDVSPPENPTPWVIIPTPTEPASANQPIFGPETTTVCEGTNSLSWSHDGSGQRPSIHQIIDVEDEMQGKTLKVTGKIRAAAPGIQTLSMAIGINGVATPTLVLPSGSKNENIEEVQTGVVYNMEYDDQEWYTFDYYYHVPESGVVSAGPVLYPTAAGSTATVYLDDIKVFYELTNRSQAWEIELEPVDKLLYGYGYGYDSGIGSNFINQGESLVGNPLDFFNVIGILGTEEGVGIRDTVPIDDVPELPGYSYAFGYEYASAFLANKVDSIVVKVTVLEDQIRQPNVKVVFKASPKVCLEPNVTVTNEFGEAFVEVSIDSESIQNTTRTPSSTKTSQIPFNGFLTIYAEIDKDPRESEGFSLIKTQAIQLTENALDIIDVGSYAFQKRQGYAFGLTGYGYDPIEDPNYFIC